MFSHYTIPVKAEKKTVNAAATLDTKGLFVKLLAESGDLWVCGPSQAPTADSYPVKEGETLAFSGRLRVAAANGPATVKLLYFDAV